DSAPEPHGSHDGARQDISPAGLRRAVRGGSAGGGPAEGRDAHAERLRTISRITPSSSSRKPSAPPNTASRMPPRPAKMPPIETGGPTATGASSQVTWYSPACSAVKEPTDTHVVCPSSMVLDWEVPAPTAGPSSSQLGTAAPSSTSVWRDSPSSAVIVPLPESSISSSVMLLAAPANPMIASTTPMMTLSPRITEPMMIRIFGAFDGFFAGAGAAPYGDGAPGAGIPP